MAREYIKLNFSFGISGPVTHQKWEEVMKDVVSRNQFAIFSI
ncbi:MAG: hypothetical protein ACLU5J_07950 [Christensenellales bacterium]